MSKVEETINDIKRVMIMNGEMSDFHHNNLEQWGKIVFSNYDSIEIIYDIQTTDPKKFQELTNLNMEGSTSSTIEYKVIPNKGKRYLKKDMEIALNSLTQWVGSIFWSGIEITISVRDKKYIGKS